MYFISFLLQQARRNRVHATHMSELHQDLRITEAQEEARRRAVLAEQEAKLTAELTRYSTSILSFPLFVKTCWLVYLFIC